MTPLDIGFAKRGAELWPDLTPANTVATDKPPSLVVLEGGMNTGKPSVILRLDIPDGRAVVCETSARLFCTAARMILAKYPDLFQGD